MDQISVSSVKGVTGSNEPIAKDHLNVTVFSTFQVILGGVYGA